MKDLELLRQFRSETEPPGEDVAASAYRRMFAESGQAAKSGFDARRGRRVRLALGVAVTAATVAAVMAFLPGGNPGGPRSAAAALSLVARVASEQEAVPALGPGQFYYMRTMSFGLFGLWEPERSPYLYTRTDLDEQWFASDGSGRELLRNGKATFPSERDRLKWIEAGSEDLQSQRTHDEKFPGPKGGLEGMSKPQSGYTGIPQPNLSDLPTDPAVLKTVIEARKGVFQGMPGDGETFDIIASTLRSFYAPPKLRAALYQVASELPDVELVGDVKDPVGRPGVAVAYPLVPGVQKELIFDPSNSALLGERWVITNPDATHLFSGIPAGTNLMWNAYLASGIVDSMNERPPGVVDSTN